MYQTSTSILVLIIISTLNSSPLPNTVAAEALIDQVCKNTTDFAFCHAILSVYPNYDLNDKYVLNSLAITQTQFNATNTKNYIDSELNAIKSPTCIKDPQVVAGLKKCKGYYEEVLLAIDAQQSDMDDQLYGFLIRHAIDIDRSVRKCIQSMTKGRQLLYKRNHDMLKLANICLNLAILI